MNIKQLLPAALLALAAATSSCVNDTEVCIPETPVSPADPSEMPGVIRFSLSEVQSRVSSDGLSARFEPGDLIGCVISERGEVNYQDAAGNWVKKDGFKEYHLATMWEVDKTGRYIVLKKFKGVDNQYNPDEPQFNIWFDIAEKENDFITRLNLTEGYEKLGNEYLLLKKNNLNYVFVFHYPLILNDDMWSNLDNSLNSYLADNSKPFYSYIEYPHCAQNEGLKYGHYGNGHGQEKYNIETPWWPGVAFFASLRVFTGEMSKNTIRDYEPSGIKPSNQWTHYGWTEYPVFVSIDQRNAKAHDRSDFMTAYREFDINGAPLNSECEQSTLEVKFHKKHAAIEIEADFDIDNVRLYYSDTDKEIAWKGSDYTWDGLLIGRKYNVCVDEFSWMFPDKQPDFNIHQSDRSCINYVQRWPENLYPFEIKENRRYRVTLPPQPVPLTDEAGFLRFFDGEADRSIALKRLLPIPALEANKLYIIRLRRADVWSLEIRDWMDDDDAELEEIKRGE